MYPSTKPTIQRVLCLTLVSLFFVNTITGIGRQECQARTPDGVNKQSRPRQVRTTQAAQAPEVADKQARAQQVRTEQPARGATFAGFPLNQPRVMEFKIDEDVVDGFTKRKKLDQQIDWLLFSIVSDSGMSAAQLNKIFFDLPASRSGYLQPVGSFEYERMRSRYIGAGEVVALVPTEGEQARMDHLAEIVDTHRKNVGTRPTSVLVFEYELNAPSQSAVVTRRDSINVGELFSAKYGYYEERITDATDFARFMGQIDDLTYSSLEGNVLVVGGRKIQSRGYRGIRVEDVAAIWQSEEAVSREMEALKNRTKALAKPYTDVWAIYDRIIKHLKNFDTAAADAEVAKLRSLYNAAKFGNLMALKPTNGQSVAPPPVIAVYEGVQRLMSAFRQLDTVALRSEADSLKRLSDQQFSELAAQAKREGQEFKVSGGSGFSLDPTYDYEGLTAFFSKLEPKLRGLAEAMPSLLSRADIDRAKTGLDQKDADDFLRLMGKLSKAGAPDLAELIHRAADSEFAFQHARYDGDLKGTEVGMVLFYTDLLAKLWAIDYMKSAPSGQIADFIPLTNVDAAEFYRENLAKVSDTRLWFGPRDKGFQFAGAANGSVSFSRNATRVYSASSNPFEPGVETEANVTSGAFLNWWDAHYLEIADYEQEYQRLNEIMKWSVVIGWLSNSNHLPALGFLNDQTVFRGNTFPEWVRAKKDLKFQKWNDVGFLPAGYKGSETEALPLLSTKYMEFGQPMVLSGGVSLGGKKTFATRTPLKPTTKIGELVRRSDLDYAAPKAGVGDTIKTTEGMQHTFTQPASNTAEIVTTVKRGTSLRDPGIELSHTLNINRRLVSNPNGLTLETYAGKTPIADITITKNQNGFQIGARSRSIDSGHALAKRLSSAENPDAFLANAPNVEQAFKLRGEYDYVVKMRNSEKWLRIGKDEGAAVVPAGWDSRVADFKPGSRNFRLKWISKQEATPQVGLGRNLRPDVADPEVARIDGFLAANQPVKALDVIEALPESTRARADILLRKGLAELQRGRFQEAAADLDRLSGIDNANEVFGEISARLVTSRVLPPGHSILPVHEADATALRYLISQGGAATKPVTNQSVFKGYFYADNAGLPNYDWSPSVWGESMQQVIFRGEGELFTLPPGGIGTIRPAYLEFPAGGQTLKAMKFAAGPGVRPPVWAACFEIDLNKKEFKPCGDDDDRDRQVYLIQPKAR
jgi:hypothetical protein